MTLLFVIRFANGTILETTWNHPFWIVGRGWVEAKDIRSGDSSLSASGALLEVASVTQRIVPEVEVYNFEVADTHVYMVGVDGVVVHNYNLDQFLKDLTVDIADASKKWGEAEENKKNKRGFNTNQEVYGDIVAEIDNEKTGYRAKVIDKANEYMKNGYDNRVLYDELRGRYNNDPNSLSPKELAVYEGLKMTGGWQVVKPEPRTDGTDGYYPTWAKWIWKAGADGSDGNWECNRMYTRVRKDVGIDSYEQTYGNFDFTKNSPKYKQVMQNEFGLGDPKTKPDLKDAKKGDVLVITSKIKGSGTPPSHLGIFIDKDTVIEMGGHGFDTTSTATYNLPGGYYLNEDVIKRYANHKTNPVTLIGSSIAVYSPKVTKEYFYKVATEKFNLKTDADRQKYWNQYKKENPNNYYDSSEKSK